MTVRFPKGELNMKQKREIVKKNAARYKKMSKKEKGKMLTELEEITGYSRKYIIYLINLENKIIYNKKGVRVKVDISKTLERKRGRKKTYGKELIPHLKIIWSLSGFISSVHLKSFIDENWEWIVDDEYFEKIGEEDKELIKEMSSSTIGGKNRGHLSRMLCMRKRSIRYCQSTRAGKRGGII